MTPKRQPVDPPVMTSEHVQRAVRRIAIREAQAMAQADGRPILAWLLARYLSTL